MKPKRLSIIVPVYNVEPYIAKCLRSIYSQDVPFDTYDVVIVNDGTKDNSMSIVSKYMHQYSNITIINQENKGLSEARNAGLKIADGQYIWFIDSDDWIEKDVLKKLYQLIDKYEADVYATPLNRVKDDINIGNDFSIADNILIKGKNYLFENLPYGASPRFILKRDFLLVNNLKFRPNLLHEDGEFGPKMLYLANDIYIMSNSIYNYRLRSSGSIMSSWKKKNSEDLIYIHKDLAIFCTNVIEDINDKRKFNVIIFNTLRVSILFARNQWQTKDFKEFYNEYKNYIKEKAFSNINIFTFKHFGFKVFLSYILIYINPIFFYKCKSLL